MSSPCMTAWKKPPAAPRRPSPRRQRRCQGPVPPALPAAAACRQSAQRVVRQPGRDAEHAGRGTWCLIVAQRPSPSIGTGGGDGQVPARLSTRSELCTTTVGRHPRTPVVLMLRSNADAMAASATGISAIAQSFLAGRLAPRWPRDADRRRRALHGGRPAARSTTSKLRSPRDWAPTSSIQGFPSSVARRAKIANIDVRWVSPACKAVSIASRTRSSRAGKVITYSLGGDDRQGQRRGTGDRVSADCRSLISVAVLGVIDALNRHREPLQQRPAHTGPYLYGGVSGRPSFSSLPRRFRA